MTDDLIEIVYDINDQGIREQDEPGAQPLESADKTSYGFTINKQGSIITNPGAATVVGSGITGDVILSTKFNPTNTKLADWHHIKVTDDGTDVRFYRWYPSGKVTLLHTINNAAGYFVFAEQLEGLLTFVSKGFAPVKYDGSSFGASGGIPTVYAAETTTEVTNADDVPAGEKFGFIGKHRQRYHALDAAKPNKDHFTPMYKPEGWGNNGTAPATKGGWLDIEPNDALGDCICGTSFESASGEVYLMWKQLGIYAVSGNSSLTPGIAGLEPFKIKLLSPKAMGSISPFGIIVQSDDIKYLDSTRKFRSLNKTLANAELEPLVLSNNVQEAYLNHIREKSLPYVYAVDNTDKNQIWMTFRKGFVDTEIPAGDTSIKALYHLDGVSDSTKNGLDLTATGTPVLTTGFNRLFREAYKLNGSSQYLRRSATAGTNASTAYTKLSIRIYGKITTLPSSGNKSYLYSEKSASGSFAIYLWNDSGTQKAVAEVTDNTGTAKQAIYTVTLTTSQWYEFVLTWDSTLTDGKNVKLYIDASQKAYTSFTGTIQTSGTDGFAIGAIAAGGASYFAGVVDEVTVWDTALTLADIGSFFATVVRKNNCLLKYDYLREAWEPDPNVSVATLDFINGNVYSTTYDGKILLEDFGTTRPDANGRRPFLYSWPLDDMGRFKDEFKGKLKQIVEATLYISDVNKDGLIQFNLYYTDGFVNRIEKQIKKQNAGVWGEKFGSTAANGVMVWSGTTERDQPIYCDDFVDAAKLFRFEVFKWDDDLQFTIKRLHFKVKLLSDYNMY